VSQGKKATPINGVIGGQNGGVLSEAITVEPGDCIMKGTRSELGQVRDGEYRGLDRADQPLVQPGAES